MTDNTRRQFLASLAIILTLPVVGCDLLPERVQAAIGIGWDPTASAAEAEAAHAEQVMRLLNLRHLSGPVAVAQVCNRPEGHLFYGAEQPKFSEVQEKFEAARKPCACRSTTYCGSDIATTIRVLLEFVSKQTVERKLVVLHSDLLADPCKTRSKIFDKPEDISIPEDVELHVFGVPFDRIQSLKGRWAKGGKVCLHMPQEAIEAGHLRLTASGL